MIRYAKPSDNRISLSTWFFILYIVYYLSGYNSASTNYVKIMLFLLWNAVAIVEDRGSYQKALLCKPNVFLAIFLLFYFFSSAFVADIFYTLKYVGIYLTFYGCLTQFLYYKNRNKQKELQIIVLASLSAYMYYAIKALSFYAKNPSAARILAANPAAFDVIAIGGGYAIAFGAAILVTGLVSLYLSESHSHRWPVKLLYWVVIAVLFLLLVKTESTITLIAAIAGSLLSIGKKFFYGKDNIDGVSNNRKVIGTLVIFLLVVVVLLNLNSIGKALMELTEDNMDVVLGRRFYRIGEKLYYFGTGSVSDNYVDSRLETVKISLETFLRHPLLGVGYKCGNVFSSLETFGVGTHSEFMDALAQHGLLGSIWFFAFLYFGIGKTGRFVRARSYIFVLWLMMIFNPFHYFHGYYTVFVLIPMLGLLYQNRAAGKNQEVAS